MKSYFSQQNQHLVLSQQEVIPTDPAIHVFFHTFGNPSKKMTNGNHFAYLEPIDSPDLSMKINSIKKLIHGRESPVQNEQSKSTKTFCLKNWTINESNSSDDKLTNRRKRKSSNADSKCKKSMSKNTSTAKERKQMILDTWTITTDQSAKNKIISLVEQYENEAKDLGNEIMSCKKIIDKQSVNPSSNMDYYTYKGSSLNDLRKREYLWSERSCIIYFYLHPFMGHRNLDLTASIFSVNKTTLKGWLAKSDMIKRWLPIVEKLNGTSVKASIPKKFADKYSAPDSRYEVCSIKLDSYKKRVEKDNNQMKLCVVKSGSNSRMEIIAAKEDHAILVTRKAKRVRTVRGPKVYLSVRDSIEREVKERWKSGIPITRSGIKSFLKKKYVEGDFHEKFLSKIDYADKLSNFITRTLEYFNFCVRKSTVSQSIPHNWRELVLKAALRTRNKFKDEDVQVVIASDETFLRFHESSSTVVAPKGAKRVGAAMKCNEKEGCTLMVSMEMISSQLLPPFVIFKGQFGKTLMKRWQNYSRSSVLFTSNHWMTAETNILYLMYLLDLFKGRKIGLIYDNAPSHVSKEVMDWIAQHNSKATENERLVVDFVDPCLTSIYQPPDVVLNSPLKRLIQEQYHDHVNNVFKIASKTQNFKAGDKVSISREKLISFVEEAYENINTENIKNRWISDSFNKCGLNPWGDDYHLREHLAQLNESGMYKALTDAHTAEVLDKFINLMI